MKLGNKKKGGGGIIIFGIYFLINKKTKEM